MVVCVCEWLWVGVCGPVHTYACAHSGLRLLPGLILSECVPTRLRVSSGKRRTSCRRGRKDGEWGGGGGEGGGGGKGGGGRGRPGGERREEGRGKEEEGEHH